VKIKDLEAGRELDALVARHVMELRPCDTYKVAGRFSAWVTMWGCDHGDGKCYPTDPKIVDDAHSPLLKYSIQIQSAWEVVKKLSNDDRPLSIHHLGKDGWTVCFGPDGIVCQEKTVELAICKAALMAILGKDEVEVGDGEDQ